MIVNGIFEFVKVEFDKVTKSGKKYNMATLSQDYKLSYHFVPDEMKNTVEKMERGQVVEFKLDNVIGKDYSASTLLGVVVK